MVTRRVNIEPGAAPVVVEAPGEPSFDIGVFPPAEALPSEESSPRTFPSYRVRWAEGYRGLPGAPLRAGDRVLADEVGLELLVAPRALREGRRVVGWEAIAQDVSVLYPFTAVLHAQGGAVLAPSMPCAVWGGSDRRETTGEYEDRSAETPIEFEPLLNTNTYILLGTTKLRFVSAVTDRLAPRVTLTLRVPQ